MFVLKKIGVMSLAKMMAVLYAAIGFIVGIFFALFASLFMALSVMPVGGSAAGGNALMPGAFAGLGVLAIILFPVGYAIMGFIGGAITAWLYNVIAGHVGGISIELEEQKA